MATPNVHLIVYSFVKSALDFSNWKKKIQNTDLITFLMNNENKLEYYVRTRESWNGKMCSVFRLQLQVSLSN